MTVTATAPSQAIAGVAAGQDREYETVYPSIAATGFGRMLGRWLDCLPRRINGIKLSHLLLGLPLAPLGLLAYFVTKVTGAKYTVSSRAVTVRTALGGRQLQRAALTDFTDVGIEVLPGQEFYKAGDVLLQNARGDVQLRLPGVPRPERLQKLVREAREARVWNDESLAVINRRKA